MQLLSASPIRTLLSSYKSRFIPQLSTYPLDLASEPQHDLHSVVSVPVSHPHCLLIPLCRLDGKFALCVSHLTVLLLSHIFSKSVMKRVNKKGVRKFMLYTSLALHFASYEGIFHE